MVHHYLSLHLAGIEELLDIYLISPFILFKLFKKFLGAATGSPYIVFNVAKDSQTGRGVWQVG